MNETIKSQKQTLKGTVDKISSTNTARIIVKTTKVHPIYRKRYTILKHHLAHFENMELNTGDQVVIESCKPVSKMKHWLVVNRLTQD